MSFRDLLTPASALTLLRLGLAASMPFWVGTPWLLPMYLLAILTDVLDGVLARATGTATRAGAAFDGWVDKILHVNLGWALAVRDLIPDWYLLAWCSREVLQAPMFFVLIHRFRTAKVDPPRTSILGRATAIALFAAVCQAIRGGDALLLTLLTGALGAMASLGYARRYFAGSPARPLPGYTAPDRLTA